MIWLIFVVFLNLFLLGVENYDLRFEFYIIIQSEKTLGNKKEPTSTKLLLKLISNTKSTKNQRTIFSKSCKEVRDGRASTKRITSMESFNT